MKYGWIAAVCFGFSILCFFYGIIVAAVRSGGIFFIVWLFGAAMLFILSVLINAGWIQKLPYFLKFGIGGICFLFFFSFLLVESLILSKMKVQGENGLDYVIVLGAQVHKDGPSVVLKYRLDKAVEYLNENPDTICIVSGGQGKNEPYSEAYGMAQYLKQNGILEERILLEPDSKTTAQNLNYSKKFLPKEAKIGIITNDFHMFRALQIAKKQGLENVCAIAAKSTKFYLPNNMFREYFAEIKFLLRSFFEMED